MTVASFVLAVAVATMAGTTISGLKRADELLDQLSRSQKQLVHVTRIQAEVERLRADASAGDLDSAKRDTTEIDREVRAYLSSIDDEAQSPSPPDPVHQSIEMFDGLAIAKAVSALRAPLLHGEEIAAVQRDQFKSLTERALARERQEADQAIVGMRRLRNSVTILGIAVTILATSLGVAGAAIMLTNLVRPLQALERAADRAGRGEAPYASQIAGFSEFRRLGRAFDKMQDKIATQRHGLQRLNQNLEAQVEERTREIEASRKTLAEIDRVRRLFFSQIGHELRTPATVIRGEAEVALRDPDTSLPRLREALEHVAANGAFLQRRLEDMLALAKADDGRIQLRREPLDLRALVAAAADLAGPYVRSNGARLSIDLAEGEALILNGDASWLQQAILAVIDNAAKFAGESTIQIALITEPGHALIRVTDGGSGVASGDLPFLFDSHFQTASGRRLGGAGLGLSVTQWVVQQHGGLATAFSPPNEGLTVEMRLPTS